MLAKIAATLLLLVSFAPDPAAELRQVLRSQTEAWNRQDLTTFMQTYWHSPELTFFSRDTIVSGWESTLARYRTRYQSGGQNMGRLSFTDEHIQLLGPDAAMVTARWHLAMPAGKKREGLTTVICQRMDGKWKIIHDHSS